MDSDLAEVPQSWVHALVGVIYEGADFCFPVRPPTWNGGDLTYQLAYPLLAGTFGADLREPLCRDLVRCDNVRPPVPRPSGPTRIWWCRSKVLACSYGRRRQATTACWLPPTWANTDSADSTLPALRYSAIPELMWFARSWKCSPVGPPGPYSRRAAPGG